MPQNMQAIDFYWLALGMLSVWRITHFLQAEDGPWDLTVRLRQAVGDGVFGAALDCFACLSLWVAAPFAAMIAERWGQGILLWLSFSAGALLLERATNRDSDPPPAYYFEDKEQ